MERNDCSIRQPTCPEGDILRIELDSPLTEPSDVKDLDEIQATNTDLSSNGGNGGSEQFTSQESNDDFADSTSQRQQ
ncbi:hypothetical protein [Candidatus Nitrosocosmicus sp. T]